MQVPNQPQNTPVKPLTRLAAAGGGFVLGALIGGLGTLSAITSYYADHPYHDSGSIGEGFGIAIGMMILISVGGVAGGIIGAIALAWLATAGRTRKAAIGLGMVGYVGGTIFLAAAGIWWTHMQSDAQRALVRVRARDAQRQRELAAMPPPTASGAVPTDTPPTNPADTPPSAPQSDASVPPANASDTGAAATPANAPHASPGNPATAPNAAESADNTAALKGVYGELSYPGVTETRIASPSPRPSVPIAAALQITTDPIDKVIAYYEPKLQMIRKSSTECLGTCQRPGDNLLTFVHVHADDRGGYVYVDLSAG